MQHLVAIFNLKNPEEGLCPPRDLSELSGQSILVKSRYTECLTRLGLDETEPANKLSYNVWITPRMLFVVKREIESVQGTDEDEGARIDINTLGFAGTLAVKNQAGLAMIRKQTPVTLLTKVAA